jgi:hypothetical protein
MNNINPLVNKIHTGQTQSVKVKKQEKEELNDEVSLGQYFDIPQNKSFLKFAGTPADARSDIEAQPGAASEENTPFKTDKVKEWNVLVYMAGDNTLEENMARNMADLEKIGSNEMVNILVQFDRGSRQHRGISPWDGARRFYVTKSDNPNELTSQVKGELGEVDTSNPDHLKDFILWAHKEYPAKHTIIIVSNHGGGFAGVANDDSSKSVMNIPDLEKAIDDARKSLGKDKFDIIGFDCCLMGQSEVAYQLKDQAKIMIASEEAEGNGGWPYSSILGEEGKLVRALNLMAQRKISIEPEQVARKIIEESAKTQDQLPTLSAIDLTKMDSLASAASDFAREVMAKPDALDLVRKIANKTESYSKTIPFIEPYGQYRDLIDFATKIVESKDLTDASVRGKAADLLDAAKNAIIAEQHSELYKDSHGISVYLPTDKPKPAKYGYTKTSWAKNTPWDEMIVQGQTMSVKSFDKWNFVPAPFFDKEKVKENPKNKPDPNDLLSLLKDIKPENKG